MVMMLNYPESCLTFHFFLSVQVMRKYFGNLKIKCISKSMSYNSIMCPTCPNQVFLLDKQGQPTSQLKDEEICLFVSFLPSVFPLFYRY